MSSLIERRVIAPFRNPVTQATPRAADWSDGQRIPVTVPLYAVAIAADSEVDICALYPRRLNQDPEARILVSSGVPWIGRLTPEEVAELYVVPVRPAGTIDSLALVGETPTGEYPRLKLDLYVDAPLVVAPPPRAPYTKGWSAPLAAAEVSGAFPVAGRRRLGVAWLNSDHTGALAGQVCTMVLSLLGYTVDSDGTMRTITKAITATSADGVYTERWQSDDLASANAGFPVWVTCRWTLTPSMAGTYTYLVLAGASE